MALFLSDTAPEFVFTVRDRSDCSESGPDKVLVPTYRDSNDRKALEILQGVFPDRKVIGLDSMELIWGLGSFHCISQQEPR